MSRFLKYTTSASRLATIAVASLAAAITTGCGGDSTTSSSLEAAVTASVSAGNAPLTVRLSAQHTGGLQSAFEYGWDFADGEAAAGPELKQTEHTFESAGTFAVELEVREIGGGTGSATTTIEVSPPADLFVRDVSFDPRRVSPGATINVVGGLGNQGAPVVGNWTLSYVLSADEVIDATDLVVSAFERTGDPASALESLEQPLTLPADLASGSYFVGVVADLAGAVGDSEPTNNAATALFTLDVRNTTEQAPDLVVCGLGVPSFALLGAGGASVQQGDQLEVEVCVGNTGNRPAISADVVLVLSQDSVFDEGDRVVFERTGLAIGAGETSRETPLIDIPSDLSPGPWFLVAATDVRDETTEQVEDNNERALAQPFEVVEPGSVEGVDLVVTTFDVDGERAFWGQAVGARLQVTNRGQTPVARNFVVRVEAEPTDGRSAVQVASFNVPRLEAGASLALDEAITISRRVERGRYCMLATVDPTNSVGDANPSNNRRRSSCLELGGEPVLDLASRGVMLSTTEIQVGETLTLQGELQNLGTDPSGPFEAAIVFSADVALSAGDPTVQRFDVESLNGGETRPVSVDVVVPSDLDRSVGAWRVALVADPANRVTSERSEENNAAFSSVDLNVTGATGGCPEDLENEDDDSVAAARALGFGQTPALGLCDGADWARVELEAGVGLEVTLTAITNGATLTLADAFGDPLAPTDGVGTAQVAFVAPGDARAVFIGVAGDLAGPYTLGVTALQGGQGVSLRPRAARIAPTPAAPGGPLDVRLEAVNLGVQASIPSEVSVSLTSADGAVVEAGRVSLPGIAGGAAVAVTGLVTLPADLADGDYTVTLTLDPDALTGDVRADDNTAQLDLTISAALACAPDAFEPNRSSFEGDEARAAALVEGAYVGLRVCGTDDDWYAVELAPGDGLTVSLAFEHADGDIDMRLYDVDGDTQLDVSAGASNSESVELPRALIGGTYFVRVYLFGDRAPASTYDMDVQVRRAGECMDDAFAPNADSADAAVISDGDYVLSLCAGTEDWFVFSMAPGNTVSFRAQSDAALTLQLLDPSGVVLDEDDTSVGWDADTAGDYRLRVRAVGGAPASDAEYSLRVRGASGFDLEVSNVAVAPGVVAVDGEVRWSLDARNLLGDRVDAATARLTLSRDALPSADDAELANVTLPRLEGVDAARVAGRARLPRGLQAGEYFLVVVLDPLGVVADPRRANNVGAAQLTVRAPCVDDDARSNEGPGSATRLESAAGILEGGVLCAHTEDWFLLEASGAGEAAVSLTFSAALGDLDLEVYSAGGATLLASSRTEQGEETVMFVVEEAGPLLVRVDGFLDAENTYALTWTLP